LAFSLLILFYLLDLYYFHQREEEQPAYLDPSPDSAIWIEGKLNFIILGAIIALVLLSGFWRPDIYWTIEGTVVSLQNLVRDGGLILLTLISLKITPKSARVGNEFSWEPMLEVAKLFAGIFMTIIPVIAMLKAGHQGPFAPLIGLLYDLNGVASTKIFFWLTGVLSAFLDNAPTYLVFFNLAGGDAVSLMSKQAPTLIAISTASVFMGALTYVGNAPNLMVRAIASHRGLKMPGFFAYMVWSIGILLPLLALLSYLLI
jgi:Na+/H+ antiporter NhaD/arsenite permease-like protein